ncbi:hypothetical protein D917_09987 [Trichinella nativa]|uniref:Uncharacterized protein n=1 Tax=Trichinella nativa TaxID=6335 RepID=A0A1Y3EH20_9BILA|nr:hypothetical protein D917_09987 [Trichinella nativa]
MVKMASGQTPRCLTACCPTIRAANISFMAKLFSIGCGAHNQLYCTYNGTVMSSFVHRLLSLPGSVELLCTNLIFECKFFAKLYSHIFAPLLTTNESDTFSSRAGGSSCQSATSLPISEYLCTQYFIKASNFQYLDLSDHLWGGQTSSPDSAREDYFSTLLSFWLTRCRLLSNDQH